ncbi:PTS system mannose/fructose/sorbose family transporter subunit IID, partial [Escherichia coli]|uniref:PTS system mannose/fructose/sorbose family transporter subunit IID n=1 Tax=Escherichia coli TaxID=562 RepID=UPI0013552210
INTHTHVIQFLLCLLHGMQQKQKTPHTIKGLKLSLFDPIACLVDAIFFFTLLPIMAVLFSSFPIH